MFSCLDAAQQSQLARMLSSAQGRLSLLCEPPCTSTAVPAQEVLTGTAVTAAYVILTWEPGWGVVKKANARALERGVVAVGVEGVAVHIHT